MFILPHINYLIGLEHSTRKWETCTEPQFSVLPDSTPKPCYFGGISSLGEVKEVLTSRCITLKKKTTTTMYSNQMVHFNFVVTASSVTDS